MITNAGAQMAVWPNWRVTIRSEGGSYAATRNPVEDRTAMPTLRLKRRDLLAGATAAALAQPLTRLASSGSPLLVTPGQTEGPFYPVSFPTDMDADLVRVNGRATQAVGKVTHVSGRILGRLGEPVRGAMVEIWQCDAHGIYNHPGDSGHRRHDAGFQGYGRVAVDANGRYAFRTIRPVAYPGRTPHIHFKVHAPGTGRLTTQMYIAGERGNAGDGPLNGVRDRRARESLIVTLVGADDIEPGALKGTFDIVLGI
jgi:protocatechuate 3,4-dioxygenase beta subunit